MNLTPSYYAKTKSGASRGPFANVEDAIVCATTLACTDEGAGEATVIAHAELTLRIPREVPGNWTPDASGDATFARAHAERAGR